MNLSSKIVSKCILENIRRKFKETLIYIMILINKMNKLMLSYLFSFLKILIIKEMKFKVNKMNRFKFNMVIMDYLYFYIIMSLEN